MTKATANLLGIGKLVRDVRLLNVLPTCDLIIGGDCGDQLLRRSKKWTSRNELLLLLLMCCSSLSNLLYWSVVDVRVLVLLMLVALHFKASNV